MPASDVATGPHRKIHDLAKLAALLAEAKRDGRSVVHCHGVFDPLHIGHIRHFAQAKKLGDLLVVTVTPDRFVNKGPHRPVFTETLRAEAIASLELVDYVAINDWPTAIETIHTLRPDIFVKGAEFRSGRDLTGAIALEEAAIRSVGGRIEFTESLVFSASHLVNRHFPVFPREVSDYLASFAARHPLADILKYLEGARPLKVLVVGEAVIDDYRYCEAIGKSSKEPTLVVKSLSSERFAGGSLAVANHVANFSDGVAVQTFLGSVDSHEAFVRSRLNSCVERRFLQRHDAPTIVKQRFIEQYFLSKLFEVYEINDGPLTERDRQALCDGLRGRIGEFDVVLVVDLGHGMLVPEAIDILCRESRFLAVNTQSNAGNFGFNPISKYPRADYISVSENEMRLEARDRRGDLRSMIESISKKLNCPRVLVTRGKNGCTAYSDDDGFCDVPAFALQVVDREGAGSAVLAITSLCMAQRAPIEVAGFIANVVGAQAVATVGGAAIERIPLCRHIEHLLK